MRRSLLLVLAFASACATTREAVREDRPPPREERPAERPPRAPRHAGPMSGTAASKGGIDFSDDVVGEPFEEGVASWYGGKFDGRKTASGELFDVDLYTAAHKTLPLRTWVRVTNLDTGAWVDVWVNDRGPYVAGRIIDLSEAAAKQIGIVDQGHARVKLQRLRLP